jgi:hypothetical protein
LSGSAAAEALKQAWTRRFGAPPKPQTLAVLTAQWAHETGCGASMFNFNFGGIKGTSPEGLFVSQKTREGYGENERTITDRFRAYTTAARGADDYLALLSRSFPAALAAAERGDPAEFVRGLRARGYFTGDPGAYERSVSALSRRALEAGFDAIGRDVASAPLRLEAPAARTTGAKPEPVLGDERVGEPDEIAFVSALAIADELGRSALRILATDDARTRDTRA